MAYDTTNRIVYEFYELKQLDYKYKLLQMKIDYNVSETAHLYIQNRKRMK